MPEIVELRIREKEEPVNLQVEQEEGVALDTEQVDIIRAVSPTAEIVRTEGGATVTVKDYRGTTSAFLPDGEQGLQGVQGDKGDPGTPGANGTTFTPAVAAGVLTWTNDGGKANPDPVDLVAAVIAALPSAVGVSF